MLACHQTFSETLLVWAAVSLMLALLIIAAMVVVVAALERALRGQQGSSTLGQLADKLPSPLRGNP
jgi:hypothetical protein